MSEDYWGVKSVLVSSKYSGNKAREMGSLLISSAENVVDIPVLDFLWLRSNSSIIANYIGISKSAFSTVVLVYIKDTISWRCSNFSLAENCM